MKNLYSMDYFDAVETEKAHDGYIYNVSDVIKIIILGSLCGLKTPKQIHEWAVDDRVSEFLREKFAIKRVPCYYWMLCLLEIVKPESLNDCFVRWVSGFMPEYHEGEGNQERRELTVSLDGKTVCSTGKMKKNKGRALHIVSAQLAELGLTFGQKAVDGKSNEIPAVRALLSELDVRGCLVVADALNCQTETAQQILDGKGDYLLCAKDNQEKTKEAVKDCIESKENENKMDTACTQEKNHGRGEKRTAYTIPYAVLNIDGILNQKWPEIACIGAIHREFEINGQKSDEWHYYISSRILTANELLHHARMEWTVETMHWFLDVHFDEDKCRVEDNNIQRNLNMLRKASLNLIKMFKQSTKSRQPISGIMFGCLLNPYRLEKVISGN